MIIEEKNYDSQIAYQIAAGTIGFYDWFVYITFIFKPFVIVFFIRNFRKKTLNFKNYYYYFLFLGFMVDFFAWVLVIIDGFCWDYAKEPAKNCWAIDILMVPYSHYNNTFSGFWILLLTTNRLTSIVWYQYYHSLWSRIYKYCYIFLLIAPFTILGYSFSHYKCMLYLSDCEDKNHWVTLGTITAIGNGTLSVISLILSVITSLIYRYKYKKNKLTNLNPDVRLIFQAVITSFLYMIHYTFYTITSVYEAKRKIDSEYRLNVIYVIFYSFQITAYPAYHFSAFFFLFVFSSTLRKQFLEFYLYKWLIKLVKYILPENSIQSSSSNNYLTVPPPPH